jgi:branched-chain amino acid transport system ATP-binding protein/nonpolar-amino-acid-transporting ATPase
MSTFRCRTGRLVGLIGPNGSGKTTLFNVISGYIRHQYGLVVYDGLVDIRTEFIQARSIAGLVRTFQTPKVFEQMTVLENIMAGACKLTSKRRHRRSSTYRARAGCAGYRRWPRKCA